MSALAVLSAPSVARAEELANPSAELLADSGAVPAGWRSNAWGSVVASFASTTPGHESPRALRIEVSAAGQTDTGDAKWMSSPFAPGPGTRPYVISDWYRASVPTRLMVNLTDGGARSEWTVLASVPAAEAWTQAKGAMLVPSWVSAITVVHTIDAVGWLETDDYAASRPELRPPLVSITFDDGWRSAYDDLIPRMDALHMRGTHFVISGFMNRAGLTELYLTKRDVVSLMTRGHEVASHTTLHQDLATLDALELTAALAGSKSDLQALGGGPVVGLAFPFGSFTPEVRDRAAEHFRYARKLGGAPNVVPYDVHELHSTVVDNTFTVAQLADTLHTAQAVDGWSILVFHRSADDAPLDTFVKPHVFQDMLDLLVAEHAVVKPVGEVLGLWQAPTQPIPMPSDDVLPETDGGPPSMVDDGHAPSADGGTSARIDDAGVAHPVQDVGALEADVVGPGVAEAAPAAGLGEAGGGGATVADATVATPDRAAPAGHAPADAEVYASYRTPPREPERDPVGCSIARASARARPVPVPTLLAIAVVVASTLARARGRGRVARTRP